MTTATTEDKGIEGLEFVRLKIPKLIPKSLIENLKGRTYSAENFYKYQESQIDNPFNFLYALIDDNKKIQGYLWAGKDMLDEALYVNAFSISKEYWGKGKFMDKVKKFLESLVQKVKPSRVLWSTSNEKFFLKHGFKRSKNAVLEYNIDK